MYRYKKYELTLWDVSIPDDISSYFGHRITFIRSMFQTLYDEGARFFWVHNTGPLGCLPYSVINDQSKPGNLDQHGCVKPVNEVAMEFNRQLKYWVSKLKARLVHSTFTYVDVYSAKYSLISNAKNLGTTLKHTCPEFSRKVSRILG